MELRNTTLSISKLIIIVIFFGVGYGALANVYDRHSETLAFYYYSIGIIPLFISRAITPLFVTTFISRFGADWEFLSDAIGYQLISGLPPWLQGDATLAILGFFAIAEIFVDKIQEAKDVVPFSSAKLKAVSASLVCFALVLGNGLELIDSMISESTVNEVSQLERMVAYIWSLELSRGKI